MKKLTAFFLTALLALTAFSALAADKPSNKKKQTSLDLYLTPAEAHEMKTKGGDKVLFIDTRTPAELEFTGYPKGVDRNIPLENRDFTTFDPKKHRFAKVMNKDFVSDVNKLVKEKGLDKDTKIILICRSGSRSAKAVNMLAKEGYTHAYTVTTGFQGGKNKADHKKRNKEGWKHDNLPWTWKLTPEVMYH